MLSSIFLNNKKLNFITMKNNLLLITTLLFTSIVSAQWTELVEMTEARNKPEEYYEYHDNGNVKLKAFKDKDGSLNGLAIIYYENGKKHSEGILENGKLQGEWKFYLEKGGFVNTTKTYLNDILHGPYKEYYGDLSYKVTGQYTNGKKDGTWKTFLKDGRKYYESYSDDNLYYIKYFYTKSNIILYQGAVTNSIAEIERYTKAGKIESEGKFDLIKNIFIDTWNYYNGDGDLIKKEKYKDGKVISTEKVED